MKRIIMSAHRPIILYGAFVMVVASYAISSRRSGGHDVGRYSAQQVVRMASVMNRLVGSSGEKISVSPLEIPLEDGNAIRYWQADLVDATGREAGHVTWDANTGEVMMVSRGP